MVTVNGNGSRLGRWKKADILFVAGLALGVGLIGYAIVIHDIAWALVGLGAAGIPLTQKGDKG